MMKDDTVYLKHILDAIIQIENYTHQKPFEEFIENKMLQDAVVRQLEIIGEASIVLTRKTEILIVQPYTNNVLSKGAINGNSKD